MTIENFTAADVPDQSGKTVLVTGANSGLGFETAKLFAARGARVLMGCRDIDKAIEAKETIERTHFGSRLELLELDLADLASVRAAAERVIRAQHRLDILVNNAGVMMPPYSLTGDGFESQFGVNHLGGFALTGLLLEKLMETPGAHTQKRVVITASLAHRQGGIDFDDLQAKHGYSAMRRYAMSKLANLLHMYELDRKLRATDANVIALACHPGVADTELSRHLPGFARMLLPLMRVVMNDQAEGAWPTLAAATAPEAEGGQYFGPRGIGGWSGPATLTDSTDKARSPELAKRLWKVSEELTGVTYPV